MGEGTWGPPLLPFTPAANADGVDGGGAPAEDDEGSLLLVVPGAPKNHMRAAAWWQVVTGLLRHPLKHLRLPPTLALVAVAIHPRAAIVLPLLHSPLSIAAVVAAEVPLPFWCPLSGLSVKH